MKELELQQPSCSSAGDVILTSEQNDETEMEESSEDSQGAISSIDSSRSSSTKELKETASISPCGCHLLTIEQRVLQEEQAGSHRVGFTRNFFFENENLFLPFSDKESCVRERWLLQECLGFSIFQNEITRQNCVLTFQNVLTLSKTEDKKAVMGLLQEGVPLENRTFNFTKPLLRQNYVNDCVFINPEEMKMQLRLIEKDWCFFSCPESHVLQTFFMFHEGISLNIHPFSCPIGAFHWRAENFPRPNHPEHKKVLANKMAYITSSLFSVLHENKEVLEEMLEGANEASGGRVKSLFLLSQAYLIDTRDRTKMLFRFGHTVGTMQDKTLISIDLNNRTDQEGVFTNLKTQIGNLAQKQANRTSKRSFNEVLLVFKVSFLNQAIENQQGFLFLKNHRNQKSLPKDKITNVVFNPAVSFMDREYALLFTKEMQDTINKKIIIRDSAQGIIIERIWVETVAPLGCDSLILSPSKRRHQLFDCEITDKNSFPFEDVGLSLLLENPNFTLTHFSTSFIKAKQQCLEFQLTRLEANLKLLEEKNFQDLTSQFVLMDGFLCRLEPFDVLLGVIFEQTEMEEASEAVYKLALNAKDFFSNFIDRTAFVLGLETQNIRPQLFYSAANSIFNRSRTEEMKALREKLGSHERVIFGQNSFFYCTRNSRNACEIREISIDLSNIRKQENLLQLRDGVYLTTSGDHREIRWFSLSLCPMFTLAEYAKKHETNYVFKVLYSELLFSLSCKKLKSNFSNGRMKNFSLEFFTSWFSEVSKNGKKASKRRKKETLIVETTPAKKTKLTIAKKPKNPIQQPLEQTKPFSEETKEWFSNPELTFTNDYDYLAYEQSLRPVPFGAGVFERKITPKACPIFVVFDKTTGRNIAFSRFDVISVRRSPYVSKEHVESLTLENEDIPNRAFNLKAVFLKQLPHKGTVFVNSHEMRMQLNLAEKDLQVFHDGSYVLETIFSLIEGIAVGFEPFSCALGFASCHESAIKPTQQLMVNDLATIIVTHKDVLLKTLNNARQQSKGAIKQLTFSLQAMVLCQKRSKGKCQLNDLKEDAIISMMREDGILFRLDSEQLCSNLSLSELKQTIDDSLTVLFEKEKIFKAAALGKNVFFVFKLSLLNSFELSHCVELNGFRYITNLFAHAHSDIEDLKFKEKMLLISGVATGSKPKALLVPEGEYADNLLKVMNLISGKTIIFADPALGLLVRRWDACDCVFTLGTDLPYGLLKSHFRFAQSEQQAPVACLKETTISFIMKEKFHYLTSDCVATATKTCFAYQLERIQQNLLKLERGEELKTEFVVLDGVISRLDAFDILLKVDFDSKVTLDDSKKVLKLALKAKKFFEKEGVLAKLEELTKIKPTIEFITQRFCDYADKSYVKKGNSSRKKHPYNKSQGSLTSSERVFELSELKQNFENQNSENKLSIRDVFFSRASDKVKDFTQTFKLSLFKLSDLCLFLARTRKENNQYIFEVLNVESKREQMFHYNVVKYMKETRVGSLFYQEAK